MNEISIHMGIPEIPFTIKIDKHWQPNSAYADDAVLLHTAMGERLPNGTYEKLRELLVTDGDAIRSLLEEVHTERKRQIRKWGVQHHPHADWSLILSEEMGEAAEEANELHFRGHVVDQETHERRTRNLRKELIEVAAVALAWVEDIDTRSEGK